MNLLCERLCGKSTSPKTYTQAQIGKVSPFLMRFNSKKSYVPGTGFTVKVEAIKSGNVAFKIHLLVPVLACLACGFTSSVTV